MADIEEIRCISNSEKHSLPKIYQRVKKEISILKVQEFSTAGATSLTRRSLKPK